MAALDAESFDVGVDADDQLEIAVEHTPEQTLVSVELEHGSVVAAVDIGEITIEDSTEFGRRLRDVTQALVSNGGER